MPLGTELGLGPGDFVLDGTPLLLPKKGGGGASPIFGPCLLWPNGWMDQDATWYGGRPQRRGICIRWRPSPLFIIVIVSSLEHYTVVISLFKFTF